MFLLFFSPSFTSASGFSSGDDWGLQALSLDEAVSIAVNNSFDLQEIRTREGIYDLAVTESFRDFFPSLTFSYMQTDEVKHRDPDSRMSRLSLETEFVVYDGGRRGLNYDMARLNSLLARNDYRIALNRLIVSIREKYLNLLRLKETGDIYQRTLERGLMQLEFVSREFDLGDATRLEVMEVEARVMEIDLRLKEVRDSYDAALMDFRLALRVSRHAPLGVSGDAAADFVFIPVPEIDTEVFIARALRGRKEIESSLVKSEISRKSYEISRGYYLPSVSVGFNYSLSDEVFPPREKGWGVNMRVTSRFLGNSFSGGAGYNEDGNGYSRALSRNASVDVLNDMGYRRSSAESRIDMARAEDDMFMMRERIALEVSSSVLSMKNSWDMMGIAGQRLELYDSLLEIERLKADMGESRRYDLLEREIERGEAAVALLNVRIRYLMSVSALEIAIGADVDFLKNYFSGSFEVEQ